MNMPETTYPLGEHAGDELRAASGRPWSGITLEAATAGELAIEDVQVSAGALRAQAQIAREASNRQLADNLLRAAELVAVPNADVLAMYELLRPGRASADDLAALAARLEAFDARACAALVREAAAVYRARGLLRRE